MAKDRLFWAAILAAPLFWIGLLASGNRSSDLSWPLRSPLQFLTLAAVYPVLEELAFRGLLQGLLRTPGWGRRSVAGISAANLATSAVFALCHLWRHPPLWAALTFFPSLVFGFFRDRHQSVMPPIVLHMTYNAGYFWLFGAA